MLRHFVNGAGVDGRFVRGNESLSGVRHESGAVNGTEIEEFVTGAFVRESREAEIFSRLFGHAVTPKVGYGGMMRAPHRKQKRKLPL